MEKLIITAAVVGAELTKQDTPFLPDTPRVIAEEAIRCCEAGASVIHLHARDYDGNPSQKAAYYREIIEIIKEHHNPIIQVSTGGAIGMSAEERLEPLSLQPEMASLTTGTVNFGEDVFYNPAALIKKFAGEMKEKGVKPELEIFDAAMITNALHLEKQGLVISPLHFDLVLGVPGALPASLKNLLFLAEILPQSATWSVAAVGRQQLPMAAAAIISGGHVRVGLEDNIYYRKGQLAEGNVPLVARIVRLAGELGREIAAPGEARRILGLL